MLLVFVSLCLQPPTGVGARPNLAVGAIACYAATTVVQIPDLSWSAELFRDFVRRIRIILLSNAWRMVFNPHVPEVGDLR